MGAQLDERRAPPQVIETAERTVLEQLRRPEARELLRGLPPGAPHKVRRPDGPPSTWPLLATPAPGPREHQRVRARRLARWRGSAHGGCGAAGRLAGAVARGSAARARGRPRRARSRLHPRDPAGPLDAREPLLPGRGARSREHPRGGPGAAGRQPLRRQPDARHARLHARVQHLLRRGAALLPARPQPRAVDARPRRCCASTARSPPPRRTRSGRSTRAPRCSSIRAATTRSTGRPGSRPRSTSAVAAGSSGWPRRKRCRWYRWSRSADRRRRSSSAAARVSPGCSGIDRMFRLKVLPISLALPWGLNVGDMLGHIPLPAKITIEVLPADRRGGAGHRRGLRERHRPDAGRARRRSQEARRLPLLG